MLLVGIMMPCFAQNDVLTVAVLDFINIDGQVSSLGRYFAAESIQHLSKNPRYRVVERLQLDQIMEQQNLSVSDYVDEKTANRLGEILGAQAVVLGTLTKTSWNIVVNMKLIDTNTGAVLSTGSTTLTGSNYRRMYNEIIKNPITTDNENSIKNIKTDSVLEELQYLLDGIND
jgi:TolB-like protein